MFNEPTVFVLGAGASIDAGFPSGPDLARQIAAWIGSYDPNRPGDHELRIFPSLAIQSIKKMGRSLNELGGTVDSFLSQNPEHRDAGKYCIARTIAIREHPSHVMNRWYDQLFERMHPELKPANVAKLADNRLAFVIFNYDRALEEVLYRKTKAFFGSNSDGECASALAKIPMIHVHGQIGRLPWQSMAGILNHVPEREYTTSIGDPEKFASIASIKITTETNHRTLEYERAQDLLMNAKRVHFLGFGYDPENLRRLKYGENKQMASISGTHLRLGESRKNAIENSGVEFGIPIRLNGIPETVSEYMHNIVGSH